jgi:hypothetical protein
MELGVGAVPNKPLLVKKHLVNPSFSFVFEFA